MLVYRHTHLCLIDFIGLCSVCNVQLDNKYKKKIQPLFLYQACYCWFLVDLLVQFGVAPFVHPCAPHPHQQASASLSPLFPHLAGVDWCWNPDLLFLCHLFGRHDIFGKLQQVQIQLLQVRLWFSVTGLSCRGAEGILVCSLTNPPHDICVT